MRPKTTSRAALAATVLALVTALTGAGGAQAASPPASPQAVPQMSPQTVNDLSRQVRSGTLTQSHGVVQVCAHSRARCLAQAVTTSPSSSQELVTSAPIGYGATELARAYGVSSAPSSTATIAILDAGAYPTLEADLATYRKTYGLPPCTTASGCLTIRDYKGGAPRKPSTKEFGRLVEEEVAVETSLDVDMASAACPRCRIYVGQLPYQDAVPESLADEDVATGHFATGVRTAVEKYGAKAVSISYGYDTDPADLTGKTAASLRQPGVAIVAASGDDGFLGTLGQWPQSLPTVISAGGTSLYSSATPRGYTEVAWGYAGSGCTPGVPPAQGQPTSVSALCGGVRAASDLSAVADPNTGVATYDSYFPFSGFPGGFLVVGGTSASSPFLAGLAARAGVPSSQLGPNTVYAAPASTLNDVTLGQNAPTGVCPSVAIGTPVCVSGAGWDGPTGRGTPRGLGVFARR